MTNCGIVITKSEQWIFCNLQGSGVLTKSNSPLPISSSSVQPVFSPLRTLCLATTTNPIVTATETDVYQKDKQQHEGRNVDSHVKSGVICNEM